MRTQSHTIEPSATDLHEIPLDCQLQFLADQMVEKCGGNRKTAFDRCVQILAETLVMERKQ